MSGRARLLWVAAGALLMAHDATAKPATGFLERTLAFEGASHRYQVFVPAKYTRSRRWPVILFLHGSGERGNDGRLPTTIGLGPALRQYSERYPAIVVFPQAPPDDRWPGAPARMAMAMLEKTEREFRVDADRVYLVGLSMGGNGAWYLAYRFPERFAAMVAICGWFVPRAAQPTSEPVVPERDGDPDSALTARLERLPIWILHGDSDPVIPPEDSRRIAARLQSLDASVRFTEFEHTGHDAWDPAFADPELPAWLLSQRRPRSRSH
jgi:predicted peptidase